MLNNVELWHKKVQKNCQFNNYDYFCAAKVSVTYIYLCSRE